MNEQEQKDHLAESERIRLAVWAKYGPDASKWDLTAVYEDLVPGLVGYELGGEVSDGTLVFLTLVMTVSGLAGAHEAEKVSVAFKLGRAYEALRLDGRLQGSKL